MLNTCGDVNGGLEMDEEQERVVGALLREVRKEYGLSQRALSRRSGVANATISQIESDQINPTVSLLQRVLKGFPLSLSEFFTYKLAGKEQVFYASRDMVSLSRDGVNYRQIGGKLLGRSIQLLVEEYAPRSNTGRSALRHEGEECGIVLEGQLTVTVDEQTRVLSSGEAYYFKSSLPHMFKNDGDVVCKVISACTPPSF